LPPRSSRGVNIECHIPPIVAALRNLASYDTSKRKKESIDGIVTPKLEPTLTPVSCRANATDLDSQPCRQIIIAHRKENYSGLLDGQTIK
jgi:hypothetical protein